MTPRIELIEFIDASSHDSWYQNDVAIQTVTGHDLTTTAVGYVLVDNDDRVTLAQCRNPQSYAMMMTIPQAAITARKVLKAGTK